MCSVLRCEGLALDRRGQMHSHMGPTGVRETFALCIVCCSKALGLSLVVTSGWQALCAWSAKFPCVIFEVVFVIVAGHQLVAF